MITRRTCSNCTAFNTQNRPGEPRCWNLVSLNELEPTATDWCDQHLDAMEAAILDAELDRLPFDDCVDNVHEQLTTRIQAVARFNRQLTEARSQTAFVLAAAAS